MDHEKFVCRAISIVLFLLVIVLLFNTPKAIEEGSPKDLQNKIGGVVGEQYNWGSPNQ